jgi:ATP synthase protein I
MGKSNGPLRAAMLVSVIGVDLACTTIGGFWLGRLIDRWLGSAPAFLIAGVLVGLAAGIYSIMKIIKPFIGEDS